MLVNNTSAQHSRRDKQSGLVSSTMTVFWCCAACVTRLNCLPTCYASSVGICSCIILVMFIVYLCSVIVHCCLNWVVIVRVDCSCDALLWSTAAMRVHYEYAVYSGIRASVCPLVVMYMGTPWESTCVTAPLCMYV